MWWEVSSYCRWSLLVTIYKVKGVMWDCWPCMACMCTSHAVDGKLSQLEIGYWKWQCFTHFQNDIYMNQVLTFIVLSTRTNYSLTISFLTFFLLWENTSWKVEILRHCLIFILLALSCYWSLRFYVCKIPITQKRWIFFYDFLIANSFCYIC